MLGLGIIIGVLCLIGLGLLIWRQFEGERQERERRLMDKVFHNDEEHKK